jgi:hypothetical protein
VVLVVDPVRQGDVHDPGTIPVIGVPDTLRLASGEPDPEQVRTVVRAVLGPVANH